MGPFQEAEEAWEAAKKSSPDVAVLNIDLPGEMNGNTLAQRLREGLGVPTIFVTVHSDPERLHEARGAQPLHLLVRPFHGAQVLGALDLALQAKYRTILEEMEEGYYEVDLTGRFVFFNPAFPRILDSPPEEVLGRSFGDFTDEESARRGHEAFHEVLKTGRPNPSFTWRIMLKHGIKKEVEGSIAPIKDNSGRCTGFRGIVRNATELHRLRESLTRSLTFLQSLLDSSLDGILCTDLSGKILYASPSLHRMLQCESAELNALEVGELFEGGREIFGEILDELSRRGEMQGKELPLRKRDGSILEVSLSASFLNGAEGGPSGVLQIIRDITAQKRIQRHAEQMQRLESLTNMAGGVAHEFNNALTAITGYVDLLRDHVVQDHAALGYLDAMRKAALRMAFMTRQLLAYARKGRYTLQSIRLGDFVKENLPLLVSRLDKSLRLELEVSPDAGATVLADPAQIQMLLSALLSNAREAMEAEGTVRIRVWEELLDAPPVRDVSLFRQGLYVILSVRDEGRGMDENTRSRLFEPFFTTKELGRGLGMSTVYGIVKSHEGYIRVESHPGEGTCVWIYLPAAEVS